MRFLTEDEIKAQVMREVMMICKENIADSFEKQKG